MSESRSGVSEVFGAFLKLGLTSFGGPVAHIAFFRDEFVDRRRWISPQAYADLVALCQFLPGPASSQVGIALGLMRAGFPGGFAAWLGFTAPSAVALAAFALLLQGSNVSPDAAWLHGLKIAAVAVVAQAVWSMGRALCPDAPRATIAVLAAMCMLLASSGWSQVLVIALGAVAGLAGLSGAPVAKAEGVLSGVSKRGALSALALFLALLVILPLGVGAGAGRAIAVFDAFYRAGALVFGGGHVVLPLLQAEVVPPGWVGKDTFLAGYGAAQAVPGPLFTFAAYLGAAMGGVAGAIFCTAAIFLPACLLVIAALPFWQRLRADGRAQSALAGVNAAVVGLLLAAFYDPVVTSAIRSPTDVAIALGAFALLALWKVSPAIVVVLSALAAAALSALA
ncbi:MAG TPA: chromate efflux transporter [Burkholderiales bacterium]|nr:chromate efflux transporter [Burkholderiales bacterium]